MNAPFEFLLLVTAVCFILAVVRPQTFGSFANGARKVPILGFGVLAALFFILSLATATPTATTLKAANAKATLAGTTSNQMQAPTHQVPKSTVTTQTVTTTQSIPFTTSTVQTSSLAKGKSLVKVAGVNGVQTQTYKVTYTNDKETNRTLVSTTTTQPVNEVIEEGTYVASTPKPKPAPAPTPTPTPSQACYPLTNGGNCYEPGEYCRNSDHGAIGVAGDGESIVCADNNGWRWEPN